MSRANARTEKKEQVTFVQEADPGDGVWGDLWWQPSTEKLRVWYNAWFLVSGGVSTADEETIDTISDITYNTTTGVLSYTKRVNTYDNGLLVDSVLSEPIIIDTAVPCSE